MNLITDPLINELITEINKVLSLVFPKDKYSIQVNLQHDDVYKNFPSLIVSLKHGEMFVVGSKVKLVPIAVWTQEDEDSGVNPEFIIPTVWDKTWQTIELFHWDRHNYWNYLACGSSRKYIVRQVAMTIIGSVIDVNLERSEPLLVVRAITQIGVSI
ncbi:MAG TPA: hypothetical protein VIQ31_38525 [Phormidium sp.]